MFAQVYACIVKLGQSQAPPNLVLDEGHMLHQRVLDHLHILVNFAWESKALLSVVLVGLPELWDHLGLRRARSLDSRVTERINIGSHILKDTGEYVAHQLRGAGAATETVFVAAAAA